MARLVGSQQSTIRHERTQPVGHASRRAAARDQSSILLLRSRIPCSSAMNNEHIQVHQTEGYPEATYLV